MYNNTHSLLCNDWLKGMLMVLFASLFLLPAKAQDFAWARSFGGPGIDNCSGMVTDLSGNLILAGNFQDTVDMDPGPGILDLISFGSSDCYIMKVNANGNLVWLKRFGGTNLDNVRSIAMDNNGNICCTGQFNGTGDFDPGPGSFPLSASGQDGFILKLDSSGNFLWANLINGSNYVYSNSISINGLGEIHLAIVYKGTVDADPGSASYDVTSVGNNDICLVKLTAQGNFVWAKSFGSSQDETVSEITLDNAGNMLAIGEFKASMDFDPGPGSYSLVPNGYADVYVVKLDVGGNFVWAGSFGGSNYDDRGMSIKTDAVNNVYLTGNFSDTVDFDPGPTAYILNSLDYNNSYIAKWDDFGHFVWAKSFDVSLGDTESKNIFLDNFANVYTIGYFSNTVDFNPGAGSYMLASTGSTDVFVSKLNSSGNFVWAKSFGGTGIDWGWEITVSDSGNVYTAGHFRETVDFDPGPGTYYLTSSLNPNPDVFFHKMTQCLSSTGSLTVTACNSFVSPSGNTAWTSSGTYVDIVPGASGCDSIISVNLTINTADVSVSQNGITLMANATGANYQWLDCDDNFAPIAGATAATYTPSVDGHFAVEVSQNNCVDTSACYAITISGLTDNIQSVTRFFPNPFSDEINVALGDRYDWVRLSITNSLGQVLYAEYFSEISQLAYRIEGPKGLYCIEILRSDGIILRWKGLKM